ncbi:MAG TPA: hypothetical protein VKT33_01115 [Candidatus Angelobacter sp.]|nr:hypothetical protein [Candidatus Angelobacter sp.]
MKDLSDELKAIHEKQTELAIQINYAQQFQSIVTEVQALKAKIDEKWRLVKLGGATLSIILAIVPWIGIKNWHDAKQRINDKLDHNMAKTNDFYDDVIASSVLFAQNRYDAAIPKLLKCFNNGHTYDKSVLILLLASLNITDDWAEARPVLRTLRSNRVAFDQINDASIYTIIGSMEVQIGITDFSSGGTVEASQQMELGNKLLEHTYYLVGPNQHDMRQRILTNEWLYHIAKREFRKSQEVVTVLKDSAPDTRVYSWDAIRGWTCLAALASADHSDTLSIAEQQWKQLRLKYFSK